MSARSSYESAVVSFNRGNCKEAYTLFERVSMSDAFFYFKSKLSMAYCLLYQGKFDAAERQFKAIQSREYEYEVLAGLMINAIFSGHLDRALSYCSANDITSISNHKYLIISAYLKSLIVSDMSGTEILVSLKKKISTLHDDFFNIHYLLNAFHMADSSRFQVSVSSSELKLFNAWKDGKINQGEPIILCELHLLVAILYEKFEKHELAKESLQQLNRFHPDFILGKIMYGRYSKLYVETEHVSPDPKLRIETLQNPFMSLYSEHKIPKPDESPKTNSSKEMPKKRKEGHRAHHSKIREAEKHKDLSELPATRDSIATNPVTFFAPKLAVLPSMIMSNELETYLQEFPVENF